MYKLRFTNQFKKNYKIIIKRGYDLNLLDEVILKLENGIKLDKKYKDHVLKGKYKGFHECHIKPDWLLIYLIEDNIITITFIDTGTHSDLFNE